MPYPAKDTAKHSTAIGGIHIATLSGPRGRSTLCHTEVYHMPNGDPPPPYKETPCQTALRADSRRPH